MVWRSQDILYTMSFLTLILRAQQTEVYKQRKESKKSFLHQKGPYG